MESLQESGPGEKVRLKRLQKQNFIKGDTIKEPNDQFGKSMSVIEQLERIYRLKTLETCRAEKGFCFITCLCFVTCQKLLELVWDVLFRPA